jgi:hypothetical protein
MKLELTLYILKQYFSLQRPRPFLSVQFAKNSDGLRALSVLASDERIGDAEFHERDRVFVDAVLSTASWGSGKLIVRVRSDSQRIFEGWLREFSRGIEQVNLHPDDNLLNPILMKPTKKAELAEAIIRECLNPDLIANLSEWGLTIAGKLEDSCGLPRIVFLVKSGSDETIIAGTALCCWSGTVFVRGQPRAKYSDPTQVRRIINDAMEEALDRMTS